MNNDLIDIQLRPSKVNWLIHVLTNEAFEPNDYTFAQMIITKLRAARNEWRAKE